MSTIDDVLDGFVLPAPEGNLEQQIGVTKRKLQILERPISFFFPAENTEAGVSGEIFRLKEQFNWLMMAKEEIPQLDFRFLGTLDGAGLPAFIIVPLKSTNFYFTSAPLGKCYEDLPQNAKLSRLKHVHYEFGENRIMMSQTLHSQFETAAFTLAGISLSRTYRKSAPVYISTNLKGGVMPPELRSKINRIKSHFDEIFLVLEAPFWVPKKVVEVTGKTMIVGWIKDTKQMFLIGVYNPIPVDQFLDGYLEGATMVTPIK